MKIENQVCTLEQAKRLKGLGVKQKSYFRWHYGDVAVSYYGNENYLSAYNVAELGVMLPNWYCSFHTSLECSCRSISNNELKLPEFVANTEAQARAAMLIYLLENNIITAEEINQRLTHA